MAGDDPRLGHAWNYFQLHANQRISVFNYFVVLSGVLAAGLAATIQGPPRLASLGVGLGLLLVLLSFVFWKLDERTSFLIKHAEDILKGIEPSTAPLFADEVPKTEAARGGLFSMWTYGRSFRTIFLVIALIWLGGSIVSGLRFAEVINWDASTKAPAQGKGPNC